MQANDCLHMRPKGPAMFVQCTSEKPPMSWMCVRARRVATTTLQSVTSSLPQFWIFRLIFRLMKWYWSRPDFVILKWDFECKFCTPLFVSAQCVGQVCMVYCNTHSACKTTHEWKPRGTIVKNIDTHLYARACTLRHYIKRDIHTTQGAIWKYDGSRFTMYRNTHKTHKTTIENKSRGIIILNIKIKQCAWADM